MFCNLLPGTFGECEEIRNVQGSVTLNFGFKMNENERSLKISKEPGVFILWLLLLHSAVSPWLPRPRSATQLK